MYKKKLRNIILTSIALVMMITSTPIAALSNGSDNQLNTSVTMNATQVYVGETFDINVKNDNKDDSTIIEIPEGVEFVGTEIEGLTLEESRIILKSETDYVLTFLAKIEGDFNFTYTNALGEHQGAESISAIEKVEEVIEVEEVEETVTEGEEKVDEKQEETSQPNVLRSNDAGVTVLFDLEAGDEGKYRTYYDWRTTQNPGKMVLSVDVQTEKPGIEGLTVEIPLAGYKPSLGADIYEHFDMDADIFTLLDFEDLPTNSIFESIVEDKNKDAIVITLKETLDSTITETLKFTFAFNEEYIGKIPADQIIWNDLGAKILHSGNLIEEQLSSFELKSSASDNMIPNFTSIDPKGGFVVGDEATVVARYNNMRRQQSLLDESGINEMYVEIPKDIVLDVSSTRNFRKEATKVEEFDDYVRYTYAFNDTREHWSYWEYQGNQDTVYNNERLNLSGFDKLDVGESRTVKIGETYKKINGPQITEERTQVFTKSEAKDYAVQTSAFNNTYGPTSVVYDTTTGIGKNYSRPVYLGLERWNYTSTIKNIGAGDVPNTRLNLDIDDSTEEIMKLRSVWAVFDKSPESDATPWYRVEYTVVNAVDQTQKLIKTEPALASTFSATSNLLELPTLGDNEYIKQVSLIPMGNTGDEADDGVWASQTLISIRYMVDLWENSIWPSGNAMDLSKTYTVKTSGVFHYSDEDGNPKTRDGNTFTARYASGNAVDASAALTSANSLGLTPGQKVKYDLLGYNEALSIAETWENPTILVKLPNSLELVGGTAKRHDFVDLIKGETFANTVVTSITHTDNEYTYYRFTATKEAGVLDSAAAFSIPLEFQVREGTLAGDYEIPKVLVSGADFNQSRKSVNTLEISEANKYGFDNETDNYSVSTRENTRFRVIEYNNYRADNVVRGDNNPATAWTKSDYFGVEPSSKPQMKFVISNAGNSVLESIRLYNILPFEGDARGTKGTTLFKDIDVLGGQLYYTTKDPNTLIQYDGKPLSSWTQQDLNNQGFTMTAPSDMSTVTAIYIDLSLVPLQPGRTIEGTLNFEIPPLTGQNVVNQFVYTGSVVGSGRPFDTKSKEVTFNTDIGQVIYVEDFPTGTESVITNMPDPSNDIAELGDDKKGSLTTSATIPELEGYTFKGWKNETDGQIYNGPTEITFDNSNGDAELTHRFVTTWEPHTYTIKFDKTDGTGTMTSLPMTYDVEADLPLSSFTRTGYEFEGWSTVKNGVLDFTDGKSVKNLSEDDNDEVILYALWTANEYSLSFNKNDSSATGTMENQTMTYDQSMSINSNGFKKTGYSFDGWAYEASGSKKHENNEVVKNLLTTGTKELYALWSANEYDVVFDKNDPLATGSMDPQTFTYDAADTKLTKNGFKRIGYTFEGWSLTEDGAVLYTDEQAIKNISTKDTVTLYAIWEAQDYVVTFDKGSDTAVGTMSTQTFTYDATNKKLSKNTYTNPGYKFIGWGIAEGGNVMYTDEQSVGNLTTSTSITLYALWEAQDYTVKFDKNDPLATGTMDDQSFTYDGANQKISKNEFKRIAYTFEGWSLTADGTALYTDEQSVKNITTNTEVTLYAVWKAQDYVVTFDKGHDKAVGSMDTQTFTYDAPNKKLIKNTYTNPGHKFIGWGVAAGGELMYTDEQLVGNLTTSTSTTLYALWEAQDYTVKFDKNDPLATGTMDDQTFTYEAAKEKLNKNEFKRTAYTFEGWSLTADGTALYSDEELVNNITTDTEVTLYAVWKAQDYVVTFDKGHDQAVGSMDTQTFTYDAANKKLSKNTFTNPGYVFIGWGIAEGSNLMYTDEQLVGNLTTSTSITLYALWEAQDYTVTFDKNGSDVLGTMSDQTFTYDDAEEALNKNEFTKSGYVFAGWSLSADGAVLYTDEQMVNNVTTETEITLYAVWSAQEYTVTFDQNGTDVVGEMDDQTFTYDDVEVALSKNEFTKAGYTFEGWSLSEDGDVLYTDEQLVNNITTLEEVTLYAVWNAQDYTVTFDKNDTDAMGAMDDQTFTYDDVEVALSANEFAKLGYTFEGWSLTVDGTVLYTDAQLVNNITTDTKVTLYAIWAAQEYVVTFDANHDAATGEMEAQTLTYDTESVLEALSFENEGHTFLGWALSADGEVVYEDEQSVLNLTATKAITLYAVWESNYLGQMYNIDAEDAEISISDLTQAANAGKLEEKLIDITNAQGYMINRDGSEEDMPVFVKNKIDILQAKGGTTQDLILTLVDPDSRLVSSDDIEEANVTVKLVVTEEKKEEKKKEESKKDPKDPATGINSMNPLVPAFVIVSASLLFLILLKKKRQEQ